MPCSRPVRRSIDVLVGHALDEGDPTLSIRGDEAEESWRIVEPILEAWAAERVPLGTYPAGAAHPAGGTD